MRSPLGHGGSSPDLACTMPSKAVDTMGQLFSASMPPPRTESSDAGFSALALAHAGMSAFEAFEQKSFLETGVHLSLAVIDMWLVWRLVVLIGICLLLSMFNGPLSRT